MDQYLYRLQPTRPGMLTEGPTERERALVAEHFAYLQRLEAEGVMLMAGRTTDNDERAFGIAVFVAATRAEAEAVVRDDPAVQHGVMNAELFPYRIAIWSAKGPPAD